MDETTHVPVRSEGVAPPVDLVGFSNQDVVNTPTFIGTRIAPIKWWQLWRWHLIPKRKREIIAARRKFDELFGTPK